MTVVSYYDRAAFRAGVEALVGDTRALFTYDLVSFDVDLNAAAADEVERLCAGLRADAGLRIAEVGRTFGEFTPHALKILEALDKYGFLTERGKPDPSMAISGNVLWHEVESFANRCKMRSKPVFYSALASGVVPAGALVRYAIEYYHLVHHGPRIIAGALPHCGNARTQQLLEQFLMQEIGHERMLLRSLAAAGLDADQVRSRTPLPSTFALIAGLQVMADQHPLAFKSVAFLLEESSPEFHAAFRDASEAAGLREAFWSPILRHAEINDDGDHGGISANLLAEVSAISTQERTVVLQHVAYVIETLIALEHDVLDPSNAVTPTT